MSGSQPSFLPLGRVDIAETDGAETHANRAETPGQLVYPLNWG